MNISTLIVYLVMYAYGFSLMIWALFFDKRPTKASVNASLFGLIVLIGTVFYCAYVLWTVGLLP